MEIRTSMVTCPNGHHYDSAKHSSCPYCSGGISSTGMPNGASSSGGFTPTEAPGASGASGNFSSTEAPGSAPGYNPGGSGAFGATEAVNVQRSSPEPFGVATTIGGDRADGDIAEPVVGWLVCVEGPARGTDYRLHAGYNYIGRESGDIRIRGDLQISRQNHAMIAYDNGERLFFVGPSAGRNIIKVNGKAVLTAVEVKIYDIISIGTTKLIFVPLCSEQFSWEDQNHA